MKDWVSHSDLSCFVVGYAWVLIGQVGPWPFVRICFVNIYAPEKLKTGK